MVWSLIPFIVVASVGVVSGGFFFLFAFLVWCFSVVEWVVDGVVSWNDAIVLLGSGVVSVVIGLASLGVFHLLHVLTQ